MNDVVQGLGQRPLVLLRSGGPANGQVWSMNIGKHASASASAVPELRLDC